MSPKMSMHTFALRAWTGVKAMAVITGLLLFAIPSAQAMLDPGRKAGQIAKKVIDWDPIVTGSVPTQPSKKRPKR